MEAAWRWNPAIHMEAIRAFREHSRREIARVERNLTGLSQDDQASLVRKPEEQVRVMNEAMATNLVFLDKIVDLVKQAEVAGGTDRRGVANLQGAPSSKSVQHLLQMFVREWSEEGLKERSDCFNRLLGALENHLGSQRDQAQVSGTAPPCVLCPGAQLGRLSYEIASRGFECKACEARALMYFGSELIRSAAKGSFCIQPFVLGTCNRFKAEDNVRRFPMPDVEGPSIPLTTFGDFAQLYDSADVRSTVDGVITAFALDATPNVLRFIRTVAHVLRPGGLWANFGPLAYDADHDEAHGQGMELSWEELRHALSHFFEVREDTFVDAFYASNMESMMQMQFSCLYFSAVRNTTLAAGIGES
mmetsp:Transcript_40982/g.112696  ORF Transcript_40982/g.112696 Transcript_40982/m.112696 type:complete len:361 (-) Transcript_40982:111-1193(-)